MTLCGHKCPVAGRCYWPREDEDRIEWNQFEGVLCIR